jgi:uncharacterized protein
MLEQFPWWLGAAGLALITLGFQLILKRPLGVSGSWARIVMWRNDRIIEQAEAPFRNNPALLKDALMAATIEEFGAAAVEEALARRKGRTVEAAPVKAKPGTIPVRTPWSVHLTFLIMLAVGGAAMALLKGNLHPSFTLGATHTALFGTGFGGWITLFFGGMLVGFGTQLAGGCTSGHGLSGCSRLVASSLTATATFFASAVAVSFLVELAGRMH